MEDQPKPLWIPIIGYLIMAGGLSSFGSMMVSFVTDSTQIDLGFLFIWAGVGFIQHHRGSAKFIAGCSILLSLIGLCFVVAAIFFPKGIEGPNFFGDAAYGVRASAAIIGLVIAALPAWLAKTIHRNKDLFTNTEATFNPKDLNRSHIPPIATIVVLVILLSLTEYTMHRQEKLVGEIEFYEVLVHPTDAETGEVMTTNVSHSHEILDNGGYTRSSWTQSGSEGLTLSYVSTPPLKVIIKLSREGYEDVDHEIEILDSQTVAVEMERKAKTSEAESDPDEPSDP